MSQQLAREADREPGELARAREAAAQAEAARAEAARSRAQAENARLVAARSWFAARSEANALRAELAKVRADSEAAVQEARELLRRESREGADRLASAQAETDQLAGEVGALRSALEAAEAARRSAEERREGEANELSLLRARGSELCSAILGAPTVARPLSDVMQSAASSHRELVRQHDDLRGAVISATTTLTGRSFTGLSLRIPRGCREGAPGEPLPGPERRVPALRLGPWAAYRPRPADRSAGRGLQADRSRWRGAGGSPGCRGPDLRRRSGGVAGPLLVAGGPGVGG